MGGGRKRLRLLPHHPPAAMIPPTVCLRGSKSVYGNQPESVGARGIKVSDGQDIVAVKVDDDDRAL